MPNERLRAALLEQGLTPTALAVELGVDNKTVERWINGRIPYRRHRYAVSTRPGVDEVHLWPDALPRDQVAAAPEGDIIAVYPHRSEVEVLGERRSQTATFGLPGRQRDAVPGAC
jgi:hypothetical protein